MKKQKIISLIFMLLICGGIGYGIYRSTGKIIHEVLLLEGQTIRVGNLTKRKVIQQYHDHELSIPSHPGYSIFLEGRLGMTLIKSLRSGRRRPTRSDLINRPTTLTHSKYNTLNQT
jgi:hypothetical protein